MRVTTMNFSQRRARILGNQILGCNEAQKEEIIFLANKLNKEGKTGFNDPGETDACIEDLVK